MTTQISGSTPLGGLLTVDLLAVTTFEDTLTDQGIEHRVVDAAYPRFTFTGPAARSGRYELLCSSRSDAFDAQSLTYAAAHLTDDTVTPPLDLWVRLRTASVAPTAVPSRWLVSGDYAEVAAP